MALLRKKKRWMSYNINKTALVDSGFWIALLDERDQHYEEAQQKAETLFHLHYIFPWPILYETLRTRFVRRPLAVRKFESFLKRPNTTYLEDAKYRTNALAKTLSDRPHGVRAFSLVDNVLRMIIADTTVRVDYVLTFNTGDFVDVCRQRDVEMI
jgi:predicted nucleic acid-binding protein